jgi:hypothetical protein
VWDIERPFEHHLEGITVSGRADVILDQEGGVPTHGGTSTSPRTLSRAPR